jgi:hypothetical protein
MSRLLIAFSRYAPGTDTLLRDREETELHCFGAIGSGGIFHCKSPRLAWIISSTTHDKIRETEKTFFRFPKRESW